MFTSKETRALQRTNRRAPIIGAVAVCAALCVLALGASSALASRTFDSTMTGFNQASSVSLDANQNVWVIDKGSFKNPLQPGPGQNGLYKFDAYPSQTALATPSTFSAFNFYILSLDGAVDQATDEIFVSQSNGRGVYIFAPQSESTTCKTLPGETYCYTHSWTKINGANTCFNCVPDIHVAIDNSNTASKGRVYLSLTNPEDDIEAFDAAERRVDFPATASYIEDGKLNGTPSGPFGQVSYVTVDEEGNIYVTDDGKNEVDEFESSGTFIRSFPAPRAEQGYPGSGGVGIDPTNGNVLISEYNYDPETETGGVREYDAFGNYLETLKREGGESFQPEPGAAVNAQGYAYVPAGGKIHIFSPAPPVAEVTYGPVSSPTTTSGTVNATVDPNGGGEVTGCRFEYGTSKAYGSGEIPCQPSTHFTSTTEVSAELLSLTTGTTYHYRVVAVDGNGIKYGADQTYTPSDALGLTTEPATELTEDTARLNASFVGNGEQTHYYFEWGRTPAYGQQTSITAVSPATGDAEGLSFQLNGLAPFSTYHYRVVATNGPGDSNTSLGGDQLFTTQAGIPMVAGDAVTQVHADRAKFEGEVNPNGADTQLSFEYISDADYQANLGAGHAGFAGAAVTAPGVGIGMSKHVQSAGTVVSGLEAGTLYHFRAVGTNRAGQGVADFDNTFTTFPFEREVNDACPNAHVRQQTGTSLLRDCRAYELVSAANSGGYDVESSLVAGQTPFENYPDATSAPGVPRVLYGIHDGGIPGIGNPTNRGVDPYVATRGPSGWTTEYSGIPANGTPSTKPFSSSVVAADGNLNTFAFGGPEICSPCFSDGSVGNPVHLPSGQLEQGMAGSIPQPDAEPAGFVGKHLSADGTHFVFGSSSRFEPDGNEGEISIYDRDLSTDVTHVVSKDPGGETMTGPGVGELDISADGSRIVVGKLVSKSEEDRFWHLYMDIGDASHTVDLTTGATSGALYDGMTTDGSTVFFTTTDKLLPADSDNSADVYAADVSQQGTVTLRLVSTGIEGTGNTDSCEPSGNTIHEIWNTTGNEQNCGVVAIGGGGGVASATGAVYFLSPEKLDGSGNGVQNAPNLYAAKPGSTPQFVATLESSSNAPLPPVNHPFVRSFGTFSNPTGVAIDHSTGAIYVLDAGTQIGQGNVYKFNASGTPDLSFGKNGKIGVSGMLGFFDWPTQIAVDNDPSSPSHGDIYVPEIDSEQGQFNIEKYSSSGEHLATIESFFPLGVSVDPATGNVYTASYLGYIVINSPTGELIGLDNVSEHSPEPEGIAVDSTGTAYVVNGGGQAERKGTTEVYHPEIKLFGEANYIKQLDPHPSYGVALDVSDEHVYVDEGTQVSEFDPSGNQVGSPSGIGSLTPPRSTSLAADSGTVDISNPGAGNAITLGLNRRPSDPQTDSPLAIDSVSTPGSRKTADFQVNPSGDDAAFTSTLPLTGYDTGAVHREVYRYDSSRGVECPSCSSTDQQATGEASLPPNGLGLSDDGRVYFNSTEGLVDRDLNEKEDAYQWEPEGYDFGSGAPPCRTNIGCVELISTGASPFASKLFGISSDGTDAYFFTRDKLVEQDENGNTVKLYDARSLGGYPYVFPEPQCRASDECHGPGTSQPPPPNIKSVAKTPGGNHVGNACKKGMVRKHGKCVRKHRTRSHGRARHRGGRRHG